MRQRFRRVSDLAKAGDVSAVEKIAAYALELSWESRCLAIDVGHARRVAAGASREKYTTPDPRRPLDTVGFNGQTITTEVEAQLDVVRLLLLANKPKEAIEAAAHAASILRVAIYRHREAQKRAAKQERQKRKVARDREELERERRRIERQLQALGKIAAR